MLRTSSGESARGGDIFSPRQHYKPQDDPNSKSWRDDPTLKRAPRKFTDLSPGFGTRPKTFPRRLARTPYARGLTFGIAIFVLTLAICFARIGIPPPCLGLAALPSGLASELCNLPLVQMLPLCPSSGIAREDIRSRIRNETSRWPLIRWACASDSPSGYRKSKLYKEISSTQSLIKEKLVCGAEPEPMAMRIQLGLHLVKQCKTYLSLSNEPFQHGTLEAYTGLVTDLDRSLNCLQKFKIELNSVFDALSTGLPYLSRELAKLESHSLQRSFLTRHLFRSRDRARMLGLYLSHMNTFDNQTTDLLLKAHACTTQFPSLEADWHLLSNITANSSQSIRDTRASLVGPFSAFFPSWITFSSHYARIRALSRHLALLNTLHVLHVETWPEVGSVAHELEEVETALSKLQDSFPFEALGLGVQFARPHLYRALIGVRESESQMRERRLRRWVLLDRLWEEGRGDNLLMDPLWLGGKGAEMLGTGEGKGGM